MRPILLINGTSPFCETFFTDVKVPKENQWGPLNGGWTVGKRLLQFERDSISTGLGAGNLGAPGAGGWRSRNYAQEVCRRWMMLTGRITDADYRRRPGRPQDGEPGCSSYTVRRAADEARSNQGRPSAASSIMKYAVAAQDRPGSAPS